MKEKYPLLRDMPYHSTTVSEEKSKADVSSLLSKYNIDDYQWTRLGGKDILRFMFEGDVQGKKIKMAVEMEIPTLKAYKGTNKPLIEVPRKVVLRLFYHSLKTMLESCKYGIMKKEHVFYSYILTQLPDGSMVPIHKLIEDQLLLPEVGIK